MQNNSLMRFDAPWLTVAGWIVDFILLNLLFVLCSLPLITLGASTTAMHQTMHHYFDTGKRDRLSRFFSVLKKRAGIAIQLLLPVFLSGAVLVADFFILLHVSFSGQFIAFAVIFVATVCYLCVASLVWHVLAAWEEREETMEKRLNLKNVIKEAWRVFVRHPFMALLCAVLNLMPIITGFVFYEEALMCTAAWVLAGFSMMFYLEELVLIHGFHKQILTDLESE